MKTLVGKKVNELVEIHQNDIDNFQISVTDRQSNISVANVTEKQIKDLVASLQRYLDI